MAARKDGPICGVPCPDGGKAAARKYGRTDLGWMGHCNKRVPKEGDRCWHHRVDRTTSMRCSGSGQRTKRGRTGEPDRCPVCNRQAYVRTDGTTGVHAAPGFEAGRPAWRGGISRFDLPGEEWRPLPGWENAYEVSNLGRVYRRKESGFPRSGRILRAHRLPTGYLTVNLWRDKHKEAVTVHRLMMWAFVGPQAAGVVVRHLDGNPANNVLDNLKYGTPSENSYDKRAHGTDHNVIKTHCPANHPYTPENTYIRPRGGRTCRACKRARWHRDAAETNSARRVSRKARAA